MKNLLVFILFIGIVLALIIWRPSQIGDGERLLVWGVWALLLLFNWGWLLYLFLYYRRVTAEFCRWVPLRAGAKRLYPEYSFDVGTVRCSLVNRHHMKGDEPWAMTALYHPRKPQSAVFLTFKEFLLQPMLQAIGFVCITWVIWSPSVG